MKFGTSAVITYVHHIPGRLRLRLPRVKSSAAGAAAVERDLRRLPGVLRAEANPLTGGVLIHYDPKLTGANRLMSRFGGRSIKPAPSPLADLVTKTVVTYAVDALVESALTALIAAVL